MITHPERVADIRRQICKWFAERRDYALTVFTSQFANGNQLPALPGNLDPQEQAEVLIKNERWRLRTAELYYVSGHMTELAQHAARTMPFARPSVTDVPSASGFIYFADPVAVSIPDRTPGLIVVGGDIVYDPGGAVPESPIVAASWGPFDYGGTWDRPAVWFTFYTDPAGSKERLLEGAGGDPALLRILKTWPPLTPENECAFELATDGHDHSADESWQEMIATIDGTTAEWARIMFATFNLMREPLASDIPHKLPRQQASLARRDRLPAKPVRVISLRRPKRTRDAPVHDDSGRAIEWHHQWIVRGHWRNQAHGPGLTLRRPKWITPYVKGPEDKPLLGTEKVNLLK